MKSVWETYNGQVKELRNQGLTLQAIGDKVGVSRERIRQILNKHYGTAATPLISRTRLAKIIGCSVPVLTKLEKQGRVKPIHIGFYCLYNRDMAEEAMLALQKQCEHCGEPIPIGFYLQKYCPHCSEEYKRYSYPFKSKEAKRKSNDASLKWQKAHPERTKELVRRAQAKFYAKKKRESLEVKLGG